MPAPVIVIGGGLSGLCAAAELSRQQVPYRLIEVKRRVGGSLGSRQQNGFVLEPVSVGFSEQALPLLRAYGFDHDDFYGRADGTYAFKAGIQTLIDRLGAQTSANTLMRMAASSLGGSPGRYEICMENGMVFDAAALIVAAPARYAERMFRTLQPEVSLRLFDYAYAPHAQVLVGCSGEAVSLPSSLPDDVLSLGAESDPHRTPEGTVLLRALLRIEPDAFVPETALDRLKTVCGLQTEPLAQAAAYWPEAHLLTDSVPDHAENIAGINRLLPQGALLTGSDYMAETPELQITHGIAAAHRIIAALNR